MAKYKFTKTYKPSEGICIGADGIVTILPKATVTPEKKVTVTLTPGKSTVAAFAYPLSRDKARKHRKNPRHKGSAASCNTSTGQAVKSNSNRKGVTTGSTATLTIPLSSPSNPYYGERALHDVPPARPCGIFGVHMPKPISYHAGMSFQKDRT